MTAGEQASTVSGAQFQLAAGELQAAIASVGASLRRLTWRGRDLVLPFEADEIRPHFRGCVLAPWPNRVAGGRWRWDGVEHQLSVTEPERGHALHGLVCWSDWDATHVSESSVTLSTALAAQAGYPFPLDLALTWTVDGAGLLAQLSAHNRGQVAAPFGCGIHPYLVAPSGRLDAWTLTIPADRVLEVDASLIPTRLADVPGVFDFRGPRPIGGARIDHAFTDIASAGGVSAVTLTDPDGAGVRMVFGADTPWVQICTSDWPSQSGDRAGLGVEPMTCPPNALATGVDLIVLEPDETVTRWWRIEPVEGG